MSARDGDGWTICECGGTHWGRFGAAGLLLVRTDQEVPRVLLQLRAAWTHGGGSWALPGGALDSHEDPVEAAVSGGEDYELLFAVSRRRRRGFEAAMRRCKPVGVTRVGRLTREKDLVLERAGHRTTLNIGFRHF